ncbi:hypothetical protein N7447_002175 [Penicillium robsamsonii]|uniref:uncharacterized protein n=1 Tax=Penicillium robsamsonii TaxID=1792511 RepID=UPI0025477864|nr:uncharacterized protein N7447_002175 [Penicillium robsamsonii]KAJ5836149.1 hypothetical protein N7447_002175 [Penicillium robsamsonii]
MGVPTGVPTGMPMDKDTYSQSAYNIYQQTSISLIESEFTQPAILNYSLKRVGPDRRKQFILYDAINTASKVKFIEWWRTTATMGCKTHIRYLGELRLGSTSYYRRTFSHVSDVWGYIASSKYKAKRHQYT